MKKFPLKAIKITAFILLAALPVAFFSFKAKSKTKYSNYSVTFINKYWNNMHLQVRTGNNRNPESNAVYYNGNLARGYELSVPYDVLCWYRRDANPDHPDGVHFTNWISTGCFSNSACTVDNP